jgi:hypothetical protein
MIGIPLNLAGLIINTDSIKKYTKESRRYAIQSEKETEYKDALIDRMKTELSKKLEELGYEGSLSDLIKEEVTPDEVYKSIELSRDRYALRGMTEDQKDQEFEKLDSSSKIAYLLSEYKILNMYEGLTRRHVPEIIALSQILKLTKGVSASSRETSFKGDEELKNYMRILNLEFYFDSSTNNYRVRQISGTAEDEQPVYDFTDVINSHELTNQNLNIFVEKTDAQRSYFVSQTDFAQKVRNKISRNIRVKMQNKMKIKLLALQRRNLESFLIMKAWRHKNPDVRLNPYLFSDLAPDGGLLPLKEQVDAFADTSAEAKHNLIFHHVFFKTNGVLNVSEYNTRTKGNREFEEMLVTDMRRLANGTGEELVHNLIKHLIAKNGLQYKNDSPVSIIPPALFSRYGFSELIDKFTPVLNTTDISSYKEVFGVSAEELAEEFEELFMRDIANSTYLHYFKQRVIDAADNKSEESKDVYPVSKFEGGFSVDLDAGLSWEVREGYSAQLEDGTMVDIPGLDKKQIAKQASFNNRIMGGRSGFRFISKKVKITRPVKDRNTGQSIKETKTVKVYEFPRFIAIQGKGGKQIYRLKEYITAENRFKKGARATSQPNDKGQYLGTAATYVAVDRFGGYQTTPYGRSLEENEQRTFEMLDKLMKGLKAGNSGASEAHEDEGTSTVDEGQGTNLADLFGAEPSATPTSTPTPDATPAEDKEAEQARKNMKLLSSTALTPEEVKGYTKDELVAHFNKMSPADILKYIQNNMKQLKDSTIIQRTMPAFMKGPQGLKDEFIKQLQSANMNDIIEIKRLICSI